MVVLIIFGVIIIASFVVCHRLYCKKKAKPQQVIMMQQNSLYTRVADELKHSLPFDPRWEFPRDK